MDDEQHADPPAVTAADLAEAAARAGLTNGAWGFYTAGGRGFGKGKIRPVESAPVRSQVENGAIPWVDTYLESESAFRTPLDPRMLQPATPEPPKNRAEKRKDRKRRRR